MISHDQLFKKLLSTFFAEFIELFAPALAHHVDKCSIEFLDKEVFTDIASKESHEVDLVVKVKVHETNSFFLIHTETQSQRQAEFGNRMFRYFARLHERHGLPVYPIVIFNFDRARTRKQSASYKVKLPGLTVLTFQYRAIQLNRLAWRDYLRKPNPVAAALMVRMQFSPQERPVVKLECLRMIATLKLDKARAKLLSTFVDAYLELSESERSEFNQRVKMLEENQQEEVMEYVTSWEREGIKKGLEQGRAEGREKGREEGREEAREEARKEVATLVLELIEQRFGSQKDKTTSRIEKLPFERLKQLTKQLRDFSTLKELNEWLS